MNTMPNRAYCIPASRRMEDLVEVSGEGIMDIDVYLGIREE